MIAVTLWEFLGYDPGFFSLLEKNHSLRINSLFIITKIEKGGIFYLKFIVSFLKWANKISVLLFQDLGESEWLRKPNNN